MYRCVYCGKEDKTNPTIRMNTCQDHGVAKEFGMPKVFNTVFLPEYGNVPENRLKELERRVMLPDHDKAGGYWVGRKSDSGKTTDRQPDYRP